MTTAPKQPHRVVIVGAGFGGLETAFGLAGAPVQITLIDRRNHHLFQPLLYQVATTSLGPSARLPGRSASSFIEPQGSHHAHG